MEPPLNQSLLRKSIILSLTASLLAFPLPVFAEGAPVDAGSVAANVNQDRGWTPKANEADVKVDLGTVKSSDSAIRIKVSKIKFSGQSLYTEEELQAQLAGSLKEEMSFADLQAAAQKITDFYHKNGYMAAIAYLSTQTIVEGTVTISILEGHYDTRSFANSSELVTGRAEGLAHLAKTGRIIRRQDMDRLLLIMNDIPGVRAHAYISPGSHTGTSNTLIKLTTTEKEGGFLYTDNYGNRYTGRERIGVLYHWNNLGHVGDQLQVGYLRSYRGDDLGNYDIRYELPVGNFGTFAGIEYSRTDYALGENYRKYNSYGTSSTWRIYSRTPWKRTLNNNLYFHFSYAHSNLTDRMDSFHTDGEKHGDAIRFGLDGDYRTARAASSYKLMHTMGRMSMDSDFSRRGDSYHTEGFYQKTNLDAYHIQRLNDRWTLHASLTAQYGWHNLDSSEKFYIGGYNAVRAYPQGETGGDTGILGSLEFRYRTGNPHIQLAGFLDAGYVRYEKDPLPTETKNSRTLSGIGLGILWNDNGRSFARLDYAIPLSDHHSENEGKDINGMWWFQWIQKI